MIAAYTQFDSLLRHMSLLGTVHSGFQQAQAEVEAHIGIPICMPNCGKCCEHNTCLVWGLEVEYIASTLLGNQSMLTDVIARCREWLRRSNGPSHQVSPVRLAASPARIMELARAVYNGACPLMDERKQCVIHACRPLACRAYGVTHFPTNCPRPTGRGESNNVRAYHSGVGEALSRCITDLLVSAAQSDRNYAVVGFLPTLILSRLDAPAFTGLVDSGKVDTAKLARNYVTSPALLFEKQVTDLALSGDAALREVESKGINPNPFTMLVGGKP